MGTPDFPDRPWRWDPLGDGHRTVGRAGPVRLIVLHSTDNSASNEDEDAYAHRRTDASAHFYIDDDDVIQCVRLADQSWSAHSVANGIGVHIEMTARGSWSREQWLAHDGLLRQAGAVVQAVAGKTAIPVRYLTEKQVGARLYGVTGHRECVLAFGQGDHTNCPGVYFPWDVLIKYANGGGEDETMGLQESEIPALRKAIDVIGAAADGREETWDGVPIVFMRELRELRERQVPAVDVAALAAEIIRQLTSKP